MVQAKTVKNFLRAIASGQLQVRINPRKSGGWAKTCFLWILADCRFERSKWRRHPTGARHLNQRDAARVAGVQIDTFKKMHHRDPEGAPPRHPDGWNDLAELGTWIRQRERPFEDGRLNPAHERARKDKEYADKIAMENQISRGELIEADTVIAAGSDMVLRVRARLLSLPSKVAPQLLGLDSRILVQEILDDAIRDALTELSVTWTT